MERWLRILAAWRARRQGAQIVIFDGGADVEKSRSFIKGVMVGAGIAVAAAGLTGPTALDPALREEIRRRDLLLRESNSRTEQAMRVADVCLTTADNLERTLATYEQFLGGGSARERPSPLLPRQTD